MEPRKDSPSVRGKRVPSTPSLSRIDDRDSEILSLAREGPTTLLRISEKMDISFVECLRKAARLQQMGLLRRLDDAPRVNGLHSYIAAKKRI